MARMASVVARTHSLIDLEFPAAMRIRLPFTNRTLTLGARTVPQPVVHAPAGGPPGAAAPVQQAPGGTAPQLAWVLPPTAWPTVQEVENEVTRRRQNVFDQLAALRR